MPDEMGRVLAAKQETDSVCSRPVWPHAPESIRHGDPGVTASWHYDHKQFLCFYNAFAFGDGGGADYRFSDKFAWRIQADYLGTGTQTRTLNNIRVSTGLVLLF
jgi:hypothetical protein